MALPPGKTISGASSLRSNPKYGTVYTEDLRKLRLEDTLGRKNAKIVTSLCPGGPPVHTPDGRIPSGHRSRSKLDDEMTWDLSTVEYGVAVRYFEGCSSL